MGATEIATSTVDALKAQPLVLALVLVNILFLIAGGWLLVRVGDAQQRRDTMIMQLVKDCAAERRTP